MEHQTLNFTEQVSNFRSSLQSFALTFTKNYEDAQDLVQDTLVRAIRYENLFQKGTNLKSWLYTILKNTFINSYRKNARASEIFSVCEEISSSQLKGSSSRNLGENKCMMEDIQYALRTLDPEHYIPFIKYFEGYKYHEIAAEMKIPLGTVKTRIHVARGILKKKLKMYKDSLYKAD